MHPPNRKKKGKWNFAIGTTSIMPLSCEGMHYLIVDIDTRTPSHIKEVDDYLKTMQAKIGFSIIKQDTPNGVHYYTNLEVRWTRLLDTLKYIPHIDHSWLKIGTERGYFYLADKDIVNLPWPVTRMVIYKKK
jgi:hypothetical protein